MEVRYIRYYNLKICCNKSTRARCFFNHIELETVNSFGVIMMGLRHVQESHWGPFERFCSTRKMWLIFWKHIQLEFVFECMNGRGPAYFVIQSQFAIQCEGIITLILVFFSSSLKWDVDRAKKTAMCSAEQTLACSTTIVEVHYHVDRPSHLCLVACMVNIEAST